METFEWEDGTVVERPYVEIDGVKHYVQDGTISGGTPATANNLNEMQTILGDNFQLKGEILWENTNIDAEFASQAITLSSSDYDVLEIFYYDFLGIKNMQSTRLIKGKKCILQSIFGFNDHGYIGYRAVSYENDTTYRFGSSITIIEADTIRSSVYNDWNIPIYIVGYKTGLFE